MLGTLPDPGKPTPMEMLIAKKQGSVRHRVRHKKGSLGDSKTVSFYSDKDKAVDKKVDDKKKKSPSPEKHFSWGDESG